MQTLTESPPIQATTPHAYVSCSATTRSGSRCKSRPMIGTTVCRMHGGKAALSTRGKANGNYKTGKYSKYAAIPSRMKESYEASLQDEQLLELKQEIALTDSRLGDLIKRVDSGESGAIWKALKVEWEGFKEATQTKNKESAQKHIGEIGKLITKGNGDFAVWGEIHTNIERRRKLVESERKRHIEAQNYVKTAQVMVMADQLFDLITTHVKDKEVVTALAIGIQQLNAG